MSDEDRRDGESGTAEEEAAAEAKAAAAKAKAEAAAAARAKKAAEEAAKPPWERDPKPPETSDAVDDPLVESLRGRHPSDVLSAVTIGEDLVLEVSRAGIRPVCKSLYDGGYRLLVDICGADYPDREGARFDVVYHVYSLDENRRVRLKVAVAEGAEVPSVTEVWGGANWCEREIYDMYGVSFSGHPDMSRILMWDGFHGHPLRKDFPVEGVDTGAAIYPEYYDQIAGPVTGSGTGWKAPEPETGSGGEADDS